MPRPGPGGEALPAAPAPARTGRPGRIDHHVADFAGEAGGAHLDLPVDHDPAPDAGPEGHQDDVVKTGRGAEAVLGQHGEVGVVLDEHPATGQPTTDELGPVHPVRLGQIGGEAEPALAIDHPRGAHPHGRTGRVQRLIEIRHHDGHGIGHVTTDDLPGPSGRGDAGLADDPVGRVEGDAEDLGASDVDPVGDAGTAGGAGALAHEVDSTRAFSSRMAMDMIRLVARILMKPGMGTRSSASRWYVTSVPPASPGSKT